ncbi:hypothetical protein TNCV_1254811, partial [Trichonephila clavipes]
GHGTRSVPPSRTKSECLPVVVEETLMVSKQRPDWLTG